MPTEPLLRAKSALYIYRIILPQFFKIRASECFLEKIEREPVLATQRQCEAAAIHSYAVAAPCLFRDPRRGNLQLSAAINRVHGQNCADFFDETREHDKEFSVLRSLQL